MSLAFYRQLLYRLHQEPVVLATVTGVRGSVPREQGAKMGICGEGRTFDTIGGGAGEAKVIRQAIAVLATGEPQSVNIDLSGAPHRETQGVCGGQMQVWLQRWAGEEAIAIAQQIVDTLESGQSLTLVTPLNAQFPYLSPHPPTSPCGFSETLQPPPLLLIVGAGHVGIQLAKVGDLLGFQIAVQDDRSQWANLDNYPQASFILTEPIAAAISKFANHTQLYAALVTRGYPYDIEALSTLLQRSIPCQYIGTIGSQKRVRQVLQALADGGFSQSQLDRIYAPIGLDIGAIAPGEIAVSIGAELVRVRRGGTGRSLSQKQRATLL